MSAHDNPRYDKFDAELIEWLMDWRDDLFSPSYDRNGWPIEMHGMAMDAERLLAEKYKVKIADLQLPILEARRDAR